MMQLELCADRAMHHSAPDAGTESCEPWGSSLGEPRSALQSGTDPSGLLPSCLGIPERMEDVLPGRPAGTVSPIHLKSS